MNTQAWLEQVAWDDQGLVAVVAQDADTREVLMQAYMDRAALAATVRDGLATYWSRSRSTIWRKGETSGNYQVLEAIRLDCDNDAILLRVHQTGPACHTGRRNCFFQRLEDGQWQEAALAPAGRGEPSMSEEILARLAKVLDARKEASPEVSYVASLYARGSNKILEKVGEEAVEAILAAKDGDREALIAETADLWFHSLVMLSEQDLDPADVLTELERRFAVSGHAKGGTPDEQD